MLILSFLFQENYESMKNLVDNLKDNVNKVLQGGGQKYVERHVSRGKLLPRERINTLLDEGYLFDNIL